MSTAIGRARPVPPAPATFRYDAFISYSHALDGTLAPAVQRGLARFAKSWRQMRALRVFRDQTSLSATAGLWPSIERALDDSRYFILFAAPESAASEWVGKEFDHWCAHRSPDDVLLVLTGGTLVWDNTRGDFDWTVTDALPPSARGRFVGEPRFVDLRWARGGPDVTLRNPRFREAIADLAATVHGRPKDELIGEDVRQHRKTRRITSAVITAIAVFAALVMLLAVVAWQARITADREARVAASRFLAAAAVGGLDQHLDRSGLLAVQALRTTDTAAARDALLRAVQHGPDAQRYLRASGPEVSEVAISPDGATAAAIDLDGTVGIWDVRSGRALAPPVAAHREIGRALGFSADSRLLATGGGDATVAVWNARTLAPIRRLKMADPAVWSLAFSPDGKWLAAGGGAVAERRADIEFFDRVPRRIEMFDASTWEHEGALIGHMGAVGEIRFSRDSRSVCTALRDFDSGLLWWDVRSWEGHHVPLPDRDGGNAGIGLSPSGRWVAAASNLTPDAVMWDLEKNRQAGRLTGLTERLSGIAYSPEGDHVAAASYGGEVGVWDARHLSAPMRRLAGHDRNIEGGGTKVAFGPRGLLISGSSAGDLVLHDLRVTSRLVTRLVRGDGDGLGDVVANGRGTFIYAARDARKVRLGDARTGSRRWLPLPAGAELSDASALSPDGTRLTVLTGEGDDARAAMIDTVTGGILWRTAGVPIGAAFSPDGSILAFGDANGDVGLLDPATGHRRATLPAQPPVPEELRRAEALSILQADTTELTFTADGRRLAVAGPDGPVWLWDVAEARLAVETPLLGHGRVSSMAFSPDGRTLATGGDDEQIRLWRADDASLIGLMAERPRGRVYRLVFSSDGRTLISSSPELELWDVAERRRLGEPIPVNEPLSRMAVTGDRLVVAGPDGAVHRVDLALGSWVAKARALANRELSPDEIRQYVGGHAP